MVTLNIPTSSRVYIDTSVLIYTIEANPKYLLLLQPLWLKFRNSEIEIFTSELTLMEVLVQPMKKS